MLQDYIVILAVFLLALIGRNDLVATAALVLFIMRITTLNKVLPFLSERGIELGILLLTISVLVPYATGRLSLSNLLNTLTSPLGIVAILSGIVASFLTGQGVHLLETRPEVMVGLVVGSIIGASLLKGVPAGPLVAAGLAAVLIQLLNL